MKLKNREFLKSSKSELAYRALVRLLYRRDHSEKELQQKLSQRYTAEAIQSALAKAHEHRYIKPAEELAHQVSEHLHRKGKGLRKIHFELQKRGLPTIESSEEQELTKCLALIERKFSPHTRLSTPERVKIFRYLTNRGFDFETIKKALNEKNKCVKQDPRRTKE